MCNIWARCAVSKKNNPGISRGLSVKKSGFLTFSLKSYYIFFLHYDRGQHCATSGLVFGFRKDNTGISGRLSVKKSNFLNISSETLLYVCLIFCITIKTNTEQHLD